MEYANGGNLKDFLDKKNGYHQKLSNSEVMDYFSQVCSGLAFCHSHKILHRDLKCENIFLHNKDGRLILKIGDFGCAKGL